MTSKKVPRGDSKNLSGSSQLGKRKQNIWTEFGLLASDVLILFVWCYCNPQTSVFFNCCARGKETDVPICLVMWLKIIYIFWPKMI